MSQLLLRRAELKEEIKKIDRGLGLAIKSSPEQKSLLQRRKGCKNELHRIKEQLKGVSLAKNSVAPPEFAQQFVKVARETLDEETFDMLTEKAAMIC